MMPRFVLWMVGLSAALIAAALGYGTNGTIPWLVLIPLVLLVTNLAALLGVLFFSWGVDFENPRLQKAGDVLLISQFCWMTISILTMLLKAGPL